MSLLLVNRSAALVLLVADLKNIGDQLGLFGWNFCSLQLDETGAVGILFTRDTYSPLFASIIEGLEGLQINGSRNPVAPWLSETNYKLALESCFAQLRFTLNPSWSISIFSNNCKAQYSLSREIKFKSISAPHFSTELLTKATNQICTVFHERYIYM